MSVPKFDVVKWCFWLVAFVIAAHVFMVLISVSACIYYADEIVSGKFQCDSNGRLGEVLAAALAAALAFAGGFMRDGVGQTDKDNEE